MSQLIDNQGREHFKGKTRSEINYIVGNEHAQARALAPLREVHNTQNKFPMEQIARIKK